MGGVSFAVTTNKDDPNLYPGKLTWYVITTLLSASAGGLIFGYDIGISGGVTSMAPFLKKFFPSVYHKEAEDKSTNQYCKFDSEILTLFTSSLYLAALISSFFASAMTKKFGRRRSMMLGGLVFMSGAIINGAAVHVSMLIVGRFLLGIGVGFANQSVPLYLSEMSPYNYRGTFNICFNLMATIGNLVANLFNYFFAEIPGGWGWRLAGLPAAIIFVSSFFLSDTPNSLVDRGHEAEAKELLKRIRGVENVEAEFNDIISARDEARLMEDQGPWRMLLTQRCYRPQLAMAVMIPFFQQFTGINVIMFYAPVLFQTIGFGSNASLMSSLITGLVNVGATFVSLTYADKWGRRSLCHSGGALMLVFQQLASIICADHHSSLIGVKYGVKGDQAEIPKWFAILVVICICIYVAGFAWSWGPMGWLYPSEIFPLEIRSAGQSTVVAVNMLFTFIVAQTFLRMLCVMKFGLFLFFAFFVVVMTLYCYYFMPETKNIPIEEMTHVWRKHWFWKRFVDDPKTKQSNHEF